MHTKKSNSNSNSKRTNQERRLGHCSVAWRRGLEPVLEVPARRCRRRLSPESLAGFPFFPLEK